MSISQQIPQAPSGIPSEALSASVVSPAASVEALTLLSTITLTGLTSDKTAILSNQLPAGEYIVTLVETVTGGNPPEGAALPALVVSYPYDQEQINPSNGQSSTGSASYTLRGVSTRGTSVIEGYQVSQSAEITVNGQGPVTAGVVGGQGYPLPAPPAPAWSYTAAISIYQVS